MHIRKHTTSKEAFICAYWDSVGRGTVTNQQISFAVKYAAKMLRYQDRGMAIERMDTHSLRSGGACALKLAGYDEVHIRKMGRWAPKSNAFLEYIQSQLSTFSAGMATRMSRIETFTNMEGLTNSEDLRALTVHN